MKRNRPNSTTLSRLDAGELVRDARELAGLSQVELAARLGTAQSAVSRWERGIDVPRVDTLGRILQACELEVDLAFRRHDDVDRSQVVHFMHFTPAQRARNFQSAVEAYRQAGRARRVSA